MQIDEIIALLKNRITPSLLESIIELQKKHMVFATVGIITVHGMSSGNVRIVVNKKSGEKEYFILAYSHFKNHALKINHWK